MAGSRAASRSAISSTTGKSVEGGTRKQLQAYAKLARRRQAHHMKPGDTLPFKDIEGSRISCAARPSLLAERRGAGEPGRASEPGGDQPSGNAQSIDVLVTYGEFRFVDLGEYGQAPRNLPRSACRTFIGTPDLFSRRMREIRFLEIGQCAGRRTAPRVAVIGNSAHKGDSPAVWQIIHDSPGMPDIWQLHVGLPRAALRRTRRPRRHAAQRAGRFHRQPGRHRPRQRNPP